jgi:hypothetical protein
MLIEEAKEEMMKRHKANIDKIVDKKVVKNENRECGSNK